MKRPQLPDDVQQAIQPLFEALPPEQAMGRLVVPMAGGSEAQVQTVQQIVESEPIRQRPALAAGLWLYVDELDRSHRISQGLGNQSGSFWHAIMHRREGDFGNSGYWFRRTGQHPVMSEIDGYDPDDFLKRVERASEKGDNENAELAELQREEWARLFEWCAAQ
jgi:hypothetical protein